MLQTDSWYNRNMYQSDCKKASSGDNQQETLTRRWLNSISKDMAIYLTGFTDGEGSFNVSIRHHPGYALKWKTSLTFNVSQNGEKALKLFKKVFKCGYVRKRSDGIHYFEIVKFQDIVDKVIPFFEKFKLRSEKTEDFNKFHKIANLMRKGSHLNQKGLINILEIRKTMNRGGKNRRLSIDMIIDSNRRILRDYTPNSERR